MKNLLNNYQMKHLFKFSLCALAFAMSANNGFAQSGETGLKDAYKDYFSIGVAVNMRNIANPEQIAVKAVNDLKAAGFKATSFVSPDTTHEFLTWRRSLYHMAQLLFK